MASADETSESSRTPVIDLAAATTWPVAMFVGVITIAIGIIVLVWPSETLTVLAILLGLHLLLFGVFRLIAAFTPGASAPWLQGFIGVVGMIAGIAVIRNPLESVALLATLLGIVWIVGGTIDIIGSIADSSLPNRGLLAASGVVSLIAGILIVAWPAPTLAVIALIAGAYLIAFGLMICVMAFRMRSIAAG